jgi:pimeloyl-ACP methyl ester carboxylesterase
MPCTEPAAPESSPRTSLRVKVPVLLINGRDDFQVPMESQLRLLELIGTPAAHKRYVALDAATCRTTCGA